MSEVPAVCLRPRKCSYSFLEPKQAADNVNSCWFLERKRLQVTSRSRLTVAGGL